MLLPASRDPLRVIALTPVSAAISGMLKACDDIGRCGRLRSGSPEINSMVILTRRMVASVSLVQALGGGRNASPLPVSRELRATTQPRP